MPKPPVLKNRKLVRAPHDLILVGSQVSEEHKVHKIILLCISPYFEKVLIYKAREEGTSVQRIELPDVSSEVLTCIIGYAYSGRLKPLPLNVDLLMEAADRYNIPGIIKACNDLAQNEHNDSQTQTADNSDSKHTSNV